MSDQTPEQREKARKKAAQRAWWGSGHGVATILGIVFVVLTTAGWIGGIRLDWDLVLEYIKVILGWPLMALLLGIVFRQQIGGLLERLKRFNLPNGSSAEFDDVAAARDTQKTTQRAAERAEQQRHEVVDKVEEVKREGRDLTPMPKVVDFNFQDLVTQATDDPRGAIHAAWDVLSERAMQVFLDPTYYDPPNKSQVEALIETVRETDDGANWTEGFYELYRQRYRPGRRSTAAAVPFVLSASNLTSMLDSIAVRRWAEENGVTLQSARRIIASQSNAQEASTQVQ